MILVPCAREAPFVLRQEEDLPGLSQSSPENRADPEPWRLVSPEGSGRAAVACPVHSIRSVAGVNAPAFVERNVTFGRLYTDEDGVAGVNAPAFVERLRRLTRTSRWSKCRRG